MKIKTNGKILLLIFVFTWLLNSMENTRSAIVYTIPGKNRQGSSANYVLPILKKSDINMVIPASTPPSLIADLGQSQCLRYFNFNGIATNTEKCIIHATSQGTATALNYLASYKKDHIKLVILEAPLVSGNNAIIHSLKYLIGANLSDLSPNKLKEGPLACVANLPLAYYWIPYVAKVGLPFYWPAGKQPIKSLKNIPNIPIIIIHSKNDPQLPFDDACALYYGLRANGNKKVYLFQKEGMKHINILQEGNQQDDNQQMMKLTVNENDKKAILQILQHHNLMNKNEDQEEEEKISLGKYQPDHTQYKHLYDNLLRKEKNHERLAYSLGLGIVLGVMYKSYKSPTVNNLLRNFKSNIGNFVRRTTTLV